LRLDNLLPVLARSDGASLHYSPPPLLPCDDDPNTPRLTLLSLAADPELDLPLGSLLDPTVDPVLVRLGSLPGGIFGGDQSEGETCLKDPPLRT
jgi:hypothetical protein